MSSEHADLYTGAPWSYQNLNFTGVSLSGIRTSIAMPDFGICFDVAQGLPFTVRQKKFFITHGHLDHAAGIPYIISQKALTQEAAPQFFVPQGLREPLLEVMKIWQKVEGHEYRFEVHEVGALDTIEVNAQTVVRPFQTTHRVRSQGYTVYQRSKKLKSQYLNLPEQELRKLSQSGIEMTDLKETGLVSFTGDTQIDFLDQSPQALNVKVLLMECTYLDDKKSIAHARQWGHLHLQELIPRLSEIPAEKIVLKHLSSRYSMAMARKILAEKIPQEFQHRVELFPGF